MLSLAQKRIIRLYVLNGSASIILIAYNAMIGAVPGVGLNVALFAVNVWRLVSLVREQRAALTEGVVIR